MRTQSMDTRPEAERVLIEMIRKTPLSKRFDRVRSWSQNTLQMNKRYIQELYPNANSAELALIFVTHTYGQVLADDLQTVLKKRAIKSSDSCDILTVLKSVRDILEQLGVAHYINGSVASSIYGIVQAAQDIDLIVDLRLEHVHPLVTRLQEDFYVEEKAMRNAIQRGTCFNAIHLESMLKVDVFLPKGRPFDQQVFSRVRQLALAKNHGSFNVASPEDVILTQLEWHSKKGKVGDDKWNDILGVLKVQGNSLHLAYLHEWAVPLKIRNLLKQACIDAGLEE